MAQYLMSVWGPEADYDAENWGYTSAEEAQASFEATGKFNEKLESDGYFVFAAGLDAPKTAAVVDGMSGSQLVTDGPFVEAKEHIAGFWIIDVPSREVALELAAEASKACIGRVEVRPMQTGPES